MNVYTIIMLINEKMLFSKHDKEYYTTNDDIIKDIKKLSLDDQKKLFEWLNNQTTPYGYIYKLQASFYCNEFAGLKVDTVIEHNFYQLAYKFGDPHGIHNLAVNASNANDHTLAFELFGQSCTEFENPYSQLELANLYVEGEGTTVDETRAIKLFEAVIANKYSTNENIGDAMNSLGYICEFKDPPENMEALNWYLNSLSYDHFESYNDIACMYVEDMPKNTTNFTIALHYYKKYLAYLIQNNMPTGECLFDISQVYYKYEQYEKALEWLHKAEALDFKTAIHMLGYSYENGLGVVQSIHKAIPYYQIAQEANSYWNLGRLYYNNYKDIGHTECNYKLSLEMFHKAYLLYETDEDIENMENCSEQIKLILNYNYLNVAKDVIKSKVFDSEKKVENAVCTKKEISVDEFELVD